MTETVLTRAEIDVIAERRRHVAVEGWTPQHDDRYRDLELCYAAAAYAGPLWVDNAARDRGDLPMQWPWDPSWYKPRSPREDLVRAASLILAEIERIDRATGVVSDPVPEAPPVAEEAAPAPAPTVEADQHPFLGVVEFPEGLHPSTLFLNTRDAKSGELKGESVAVDDVVPPSIEAAENYVFSFLSRPPVSEGATAYSGEDSPYANEANAVVVNRAANLIKGEGRGRGNVALVHRDDLPLLISKPSTAFKPTGVTRSYGRWTFVGTLNDVDVWTTTEMPKRVWRGQAIVVHVGDHIADRVASVATMCGGTKVAIQRCGSNRVVDDFIRIVDMYPERRKPVTL